MDVSSLETYSTRWIQTDLHQTKASLRFGIHIQDFGSGLCFADARRAAQVLYWAAVGVHL